MKKQLLNPAMILSTAAVVTFLTGCATNTGYSDVSGPRSALAFTTVTQPGDLNKWTGDRYMMLSLRSMDTYFFQVPDTGYRPGGTEVVIDNPAGPTTVVTTPTDAMGAAPGPYQSETRSYKVIEYNPGHAH